jgi:hypothetical protein
MEKDYPHKIIQYHDKSYAVIGWREWVSLPCLGINKIKAKVDTGARTSALHAFSIERFKEHGRDKVRFEIHPIQRNDEFIVQCTADLVDIRNVIDSGGHRELRHVIETTVILGGLVRIIHVTLTDRSSMNFRMLLGRKALQSYYIIDPARSFHT